MKIAVNKCFGGFQLSDEAYNRLMELGIKVYKDWKALEKLEKDELWIIEDNSYNTKRYYSNLTDREHRTNELLIKVIEELGEKASGSLGNVKILDIPDNIEWEWDEYDGIESIHEIHQSW